MNTEAQYKKVLDYIAEKITHELQTGLAPNMRCVFINGPVQYGLFIERLDRDIPNLSAVANGTITIAGMSYNAAEYFKTHHRHACRLSTINTPLDSFFRMTVDELLVAIDLDMTYSKKTW